MLTLGIIADTHVPDRARQLDPGVLAIFDRAGVAAILHAGDICAPSVLAQLETLAPVYAVRGNRDIWHMGHLPTQLELTFAGVSIGLTHGHNGLTGYFSQKLSYFVAGYQLPRFEKQLAKRFPAAQVIIFGHTHRSENTRVNGRLIFNPGASSPLLFGNIPPSVGLLHLQDGAVWGEIIPLASA